MIVGHRKLFPVQNLLISKDFHCLGMLARVYAHGCEIVYMWKRVDSNCFSHVVRTYICFHLHPNKRCIVSQLDIFVVCLQVAQKGDVCSMNTNLLHCQGSFVD